FPLTSMEVNREIGRVLVERLGMRASMKAPELNVFIEITSEGAFVFFGKERGPGGLPVGISGRVLCLFSGGIDSPVAAWLMMKRGCGVDFVHFHALRTEREARQSKIPELLGHLTRYSFSSRLYLAPFLPFHLATLETSSKHELMLFRRFMLKVAERIAGREGLRGLVTGDSLGQVASQTLENMAVVEDAVSVPVFRPLLAYDKEETVGLARQIGTYEHSIRPYKDCCSILARHPETRARLRFVRQAERRLDREHILRDTMDGIQVLTLKPDGQGNHDGKISEERGRLS
ncbi:MAG: tRNA uracil 4-sulfurtransferase ThiI, partial [Candidatus Geothermarchaeales archaeon]